MKLLLAVLIVLFSITYNNRLSAKAIDYNTPSFELPNGVKCDIGFAQDSVVGIIWLKLAITFSNERDTWITIGTPYIRNAQYIYVTEKNKSYKKLKPKNIVFPKITNALALAPKSSVVLFLEIRKLENKKRKNDTTAKLEVSMNFSLNIELEKKNHHRIGQYSVEQTLKGENLWAWDL